MAEIIFAYGDSVPASRTGAILPITIPFGSQIDLASVALLFDGSTPLPNRVEINATVGVGGTANVSQILFSIFRDGILIFTAQQGVQNASEQFYNVRMTAVDFNVPPGSHTYTLRVQRLTAGATASVAGPITLGVAGIGPVA